MMVLRTQSTCLLPCHAQFEDQNDHLNGIDVMLRPHGLKNSSNEYLIHFFLHNCEKMFIDSTKTLFEAMLEYIQATERFQ